MVQYDILNLPVCWIVGPDWSAQKLSDWTSNLAPSAKDSWVLGADPQSMKPGRIYLVPKEFAGNYPIGADFSLSNTRDSGKDSHPFPYVRSQGCIFLANDTETLPDWTTQPTENQKVWVLREGSDPRIVLDEMQAYARAIIAKPEPFLAQFDAPLIHRHFPSDKQKSISLELQEAWFALVDNLGEQQPVPWDSTAIISSTDQASNLSSDLIFAFDSRLRLTYFNHSLNYYMQQYLGVSLVLGNAVVLQGLPGDIGEVWKRLFDQVSLGFSVTKLLHYELKQESRLFSLRMYPYHESHTDLCGGVAVLSDVTDVRQNQEKLRFSDALFQKITDQSPIGLFLLDADRKMTWMNHQMKAILDRADLDQEQFESGSGWLDGLIASEKIDWNKLTQGIAQELKVKATHPPTLTLRITLSSQADKDNLNPGWVGSLEDVTEVRLSQEEIMEIFFTSPDLIFVVDWNGIIQKANPAWTNILGYPMDELVGINIRSITPSEDQSDLEEAKVYWRQMTGKMLSYKSRIIARDGREHWINWHVTIDTDNELIRGVGQEVTSQVEEEARLRILESVVLNTNDAVVITTAQLSEAPGPEIVFVNRAFTQMTGYSQEEVKGLTPAFLYQEDDYATLGELLGHSLVDGNAVKVEMINYRKDGSNFWAAVSIVVVRDNNHHATHFVTVKRDITEQKESEISIRRFEAYQRSILQNSSQLVTLVDKQGMILAMNRQATEGYNEAMLIEPRVGRLLTEYLTEELGLFFQKALSRTLKGDTLNGIQEWKGLNGRTYWYRYRYAPAYDPNGELYGSVFMLDDITTIKEQEMQLFEMTKRMALATQGAGVGIWEWNLVTSRLFWDDITLAFYQVRREDFRGTFLDWKEHVHPEDIDYSVAIIQASLAARSNYSNTFRIIRGDGEIRYIKAFASIQYSADGQPEKFLGVNTDVTSEKQAEERLLKAKEMAEEMTRLKTNFLANMSHEIRTPINGIMGLLELMADEPESAMRQEYMKMMQKSGSRLLNTLTGILELSRLEAEGAGYQLTPINVQVLLTSVLESLTPVAITKKVTLQAEMAEDDLLVLGDERMLNQILNNIVGNALKFTPQGSVTLSVSLKNLKKNKAFVVIQVQDTGIGIASEHLEKIFHPFKQESEGRQRQFEGVGLGLSIARKYSELLGGTIEVESTKGTGSIFKVILPAYVQAPAFTEQHVSSMTDSPAIS